MPKLPFGCVLVGRRVLDPDSDPTGGILVENEPAQVRNHRNKKLDIHSGMAVAPANTKYDLVQQQVKEGSAILTSGY